MENLEKKKSVLVCPLDWGIGHATRCVPVIRHFLDQGFRVVIGSDRRPMAFLKREFPELEFVRFPGTHVIYPQRSLMVMKILFQGPKLLSGIRKEHKMLRKIVGENGIDLVFSDNRYGLWSEDVPAIFMTHQLQIKVPRYLGMFSPILQRINYGVIGKYTECWVPDFQNHKGLAGDLSHPERLPERLHYIGTLSRFSGARHLPGTGKIPPFEILILLSGPEPQRTILEETLLSQLQDTTIKTVIVRGITERQEERTFSENIRIFSHLESNLLQEYIRNALVVICRSGYSSLMDIAAMGKRAIFIPTPGQTEQEYLASYLMAKKIYFSMPQKTFDLIYALEMSKNYPGMVLENDYKDLEERIDEVSRKMRNEE
ncbi:MAG: glycosyl transferase family 28 [Bacteroidales bacterium]|nr:glycosyl transferase family 28 [Bacteroidales bacterium]